MNLRGCVIVFWLQVVYSQLYDVRYEGDDCLLENNEKGKCVRLSQCHSAVEKIQRREHPVTCVYIRKTPIVCCPVSENLKPRISDKKCLIYQKAKLRPTEEPPTTSFDETQIVIEDAVNADFPNSPLSIDLHLDPTNNFTSDDFDYSDILNADTAVRQDVPISQEENKISLNETSSNSTKDIPIPVRGIFWNLNNTNITNILNETNSDEIVTVYLRLNYTEDTSKEIQDPLNITILNITSSNPDSYNTTCETLCNILQEHNLNLTDYTSLKESNVPLQEKFASLTDAVLSSMNGTTVLEPSMNQTELSNTTEVGLSSNTEGEMLFTTEAVLSRTDNSELSDTTENYDYPILTNDDKSIVLGFVAQIEEFPHVVALGYTKGDELLWRCGGSLVSEKFVLTAAHCLSSTELGEVQWVSLGSNEINLSFDSTPYFSQHIYKVIRRIPHPLFKRPASYHDIALLELEWPVEFTTSIRPACLPASHKMDPQVQLIATGWGLTKYGSNASEALQKVNLDVYSDQECVQIYDDMKGSRRLRNGVAEEQFCAGGREGEQDTCSRDSGGPLQLKIDDSNGATYVIFGITSFGKSCGLYGLPGIYTKVSKYIPWLENQIWPNEF